MNRSTLAALLKNILNTLTLLSMSPDWVTLSELSDSLAKDDSIPHEVTEQIFEWFGSNLGQGKWKLEIPEVVSEIGKAILSASKVRLQI